jgi:lipopolysaccharide/colanic/teichoic acid biosynthesis glycosyltransferase
LALLSLFDPAKRAFDIVGALILVPVVLLVALVVKIVQLHSRGSLFFVQDRIGKDGAPFRMVKFRTMESDAGCGLFATDLAHKIIPGGHALRRYRLDELPQIWNILKGDMSFIGPRPEQPKFVEEFDLRIPGYASRHAIRPGLSGLSQVRMGYASCLQSSRKKLAYDRFYIDQRCFVLEAKIVVWTVRTLITGEGAV